MDAVTEDRLLDGAVRLRQAARGYRAGMDAALLADDLPPAAYSDPGFVQFLKSGGTQAR